MSIIDYSIVIRTTGNAGKKYEMLLQSINNLNLQPKEIIVVLPEGYNEPKEKIGYEHFYYCKKGMVNQRIYGLNVCKTKYALFCDDDVSFERDFVEKLYRPIKENKSAFSAGPLVDFFPDKGIKSVVSLIIGGATPTFFCKNRYNHILRTTGYSYNRNLKNKEYFYTDSLPWTCFFADVSAMKDINMESEMWLDKNGYAALDDQTMFYKAILRGYKTLVVKDALYKHNDAKTSFKENDKVLYCSAFNRTVFWHRFIYLNQKNPILKIWAIICFKYMKTMMKIFNYIQMKRGKIDFHSFHGLMDGFKDGSNYLSSDEYLNLPKIL